MATIRGAALNLAIPVSRLTEFLAPPGLVFDPPPLVYKDRFRPVTWTIKVQPATPGLKLPEKLSVEVTVANGIGEPAHLPSPARRRRGLSREGHSVPRDPDRMVELAATFPNGQTIVVQVKDGDVQAGGVKFLLSDCKRSTAARSRASSPAGASWPLARSSA